ncbi:DNA-formamidopyrimidine glycosylase family protein [Kineococcus rhizosphaerae]|uniref:DNA-(apurinic or apyrimidinic site) lyase n=1 Tax=Kineococcus rhizosphaerae TaxID=559628 RepID=A0A2T0RBE4_9ACTN|nr:DNA-formamidopyrimidine glycosylase family protein [Kineococcus rhizosphaerae]PRY18496.1 endonuclease-8 [Kineococcus rhizosphaerae]
MPEGDVVWRTARRLDKALSGRELTGSDLRWPSLATVDLSGRAVLETVSAGKHLLTRVAAGGDDPPVTLHSHLRMEGSWFVERTGEPGQRRSASGIRAVLTTRDWTAVGHKLGMLDLVPTDREDELVGHLGPDLLGPGWDPAEAERRLLERPERELGAALLDQRVLAGVGTFYLAEACFLARLTPWSPVADLDDPAAFIALVHRLLDANKSRADQVTTGDLRRGRQNFAHARSGLPCLRCGATVRVAMIGTPPQDRTAFYCPGCQRGPAPTDDGRPQRPLGSSGRPSGRATYRTRR